MSVTRRTAISAMAGVFGAALLPEIACGVAQGAVDAGTTHPAASAGLDELIAQLLELLDFMPRRTCSEAELLEEWQPIEIKAKELIDASDIGKPFKQNLHISLLIIKRTYIQAFAQPELVNHRPDFWLTVATT